MFNDERDNEKEKERQRERDSERKRVKDSYNKKKAKSNNQKYYFFTGSKIMYVQYYNALASMKMIHFCI